MTDTFVTNMLSLCLHEHQPAVNSLSFCFDRTRLVIVSCLSFPMDSDLLLFSQFEGFSLNSKPSESHFIEKVCQRISKQNSFHFTLISPKQNAETTFSLSKSKTRTTTSDKSFFSVYLL